MGLFDWLRGPDVNAGVEEYRTTPGAVLLDVRTGAEYSEGHIPGSRNIPLQLMDGETIGGEGPDTPVFVYCYSGARSRQAAELLRRGGFTRVKNIGGIAGYTGKTEV